MQPNAKTRKSVDRVTNISRFTNFKYEADGLMRVYQAYSVGKGKIIRIKGSDYFVPLNPILEKGEHGFRITDSSSLTQYKQRTRNIYLARLCPNPGCTGVMIPGEPHEHQIGQISDEDVKGLDRYKAQWGEVLMGENSGLHGKTVYQVCLIPKIGLITQHLHILLTQEIASHSPSPVADLKARAAQG